MVLVITRIPTENFLRNLNFHCSPTRGVEIELPGSDSGSGGVPQSDSSSIPFENRWTLRTHQDPRDRRATLSFTKS